MRIIIIILLCFLGQFGFSQTKIQLTSPFNHQDDYHFVNISDSAFVKITHMEDMDVWYGQSFSLKANVPDGQYEIYLDDTLKLRAFIKDLNKDSIWTTFYSNGQIQSLTPYIFGKRTGEVTEFYKSGSVQRQGMYSNDCPINEVIAFYESGMIEAKFYYDNCEYVKQEVYDENGKIKFIYDPKTGKTITK